VDGARACAAEGTIRGLLRAASLYKTDAPGAIKLWEASVKYDPQNRQAQAKLQEARAALGFKGSRPAWAQVKLLSRRELRSRRLGPSIGVVRTSRPSSWSIALALELGLD
jgi:hypothetical protein